MTKPHDVMSGFDPDEVLYTVRYLEEFQSQAILLERTYPDDGRVEIEKWADRTPSGRGARYIRVRSTPRLIDEYLCSKITMLTLLTESEFGDCRTVDYDGEMIVVGEDQRLTSLPAAYLPGVDCYHDFSLRGDFEMTKSQAYAYAKHLAIIELDRLSSGNRIENMNQGNINTELIKSGIVRIMKDLGQR